MKWILLYLLCRWGVGGSAQVAQRLETELEPQDRNQLTWAHLVSEPQPLGAQALFLLPYRRGNWGARGVKETPVSQSYWEMGWADPNPSSSTANSLLHPSSLPEAAWRGRVETTLWPLQSFFFWVPGTVSSRSLFRMWAEVGIWLDNSCHMNWVTQLSLRNVCPREQRPALSVPWYEVTSGKSMSNLKPGGKEKSLGAATKFQL